MKSMDMEEKKYVKVDESSVIGKLLDLIPVLKSMELTFVLYIAASFAIAAVLYVISGWIMEKKLSV